MYVDTMANENTTKYTPTVSGVKATSQLGSGAMKGGSVFRM